MNTTELSRCATCRHWKDDANSDLMAREIMHPDDIDTGDPMVMPFEVRECKHPKLVFFERPVERDGFAVSDGSQYFAGLFTAENFGCVRHEPLENT